MISVVTALADTLNAYLRLYPGCETLGYVYDCSDGLPTPDSLSLPSNKPVILFGHPFQTTHDVDASNPHVRAATMGMGGVVNDLIIVQMILLYCVMDLDKLATGQHIARPYHEFGVQDCIRQHNTLGTYGSPVFRAVATTGKAGAFVYGKINYYSGQWPIEISCSRQVSPGS